METYWELRRSTATAPAGGVCAALAGRWGVDPLLIRVACVLLALSSGLGLVAYAAAWALLPSDTDDVRPLHRWWPAMAQVPLTWWAGLALIASCAFALSVGPALPFGLWPAVVLGVVAYWGRREARHATADVGAPVELARKAIATSDTFAAAAIAWQHRVAQAVTGAAPVPVSPASAWRAERHRRHRSRRALWLSLSTWSAAALVVGALLTLRESGYPLGWDDIAGSVAVVFGVGLVASAWFGRRRLLTFGAVLAALACAAAVLPARAMPLHRQTWTDPATLPATLRLADGQRHQLDLSALSPSPVDRTVAVACDACVVTLILPAQENVAVDGRVEGLWITPDGTLLADGEPHRESLSPRPGEPTLSLATTVAGILVVIG